MSKSSHRKKRAGLRARNPNWETTPNGWRRLSIDDYLANPGDNLQDDVSEGSTGFWQRVRENTNNFSHTTLEHAVNPIKQALSKGWSYVPHEKKRYIASLGLALTMVACQATATPTQTPYVSPTLEPTPSAVVTVEPSPTLEPTPIPAPEPVALDQIIAGCEDYESTIPIDIELLEDGSVASVVEAGVASDCYGQDYDAKIHGLWSHMFHQGGGFLDEHGNPINHNLVKPGIYSIYAPEGVGGEEDGFRIVATPTPTPTATATPVPVYTLSGMVFFDYNGSGLQDGGEPGIQNVPVCVVGLDKCTVSGADGSYSLTDIVQGAHRISVQSPTQAPATAFRYISRFIKWVDIPAYTMNGVNVPAQHLPDTKVIPIETGVGIDLESNTVLDIALSQGLMLFPIPSGYPAYILGYFDLDFQESIYLKNGSVRNYLGETYDWTQGYPLAPVTSNNIDPTTLVFPGITGTQDGHIGIDIRLNLSTPVIAPLSGEIIDIYWENGQNIKIKYNPIGSEQYMSFLGHLDPRVLVEIGQKVYAGQTIALSGDTGEGNKYVTGGNAIGIPLLHIHTARWPEQGEGEFFDFYRNVSGIESPLNNSDRSLWTVDNKPIRIPLSFNIENLMIH